MLARTASLLLVVLLADATRAQSTLDKVTYRRGGQLLTESGEVKDSPGGVTLTAGGEARRVESQDIVRVESAALAGVPLSELVAARGFEAAGDSAKAQVAFAALLRRAAGAPEASRRHLAFREAMAAARVADAQPGPGFEAAAKPAIVRLVAAGKRSEKSWEAWPARRAAARMQAELGDAAGAAATLQALAALEGLSRGQRQQTLLTAAAYLARAGNPAYRGVLGAVEAEGVADALKDEFAVLKAAGTPGLQGAVDAASDPAAKGVGYTLLGASHEASGESRAAMWDYLWAEAVYAEDRDATLAALGRLAALFEKQGDKARAEQFRERLVRARLEG